MEYRIEIEVVELNLPTGFRRNTYSSIPID